MTDLIYTDTKLLSLLQARDETALSAIYRQHGKQVLHLAKRILGSEQDAEECVNDALLDLWNSVPPAEPNVIKLRKEPSSEMDLALFLQKS